MCLFNSKNFATSATVVEVCALLGVILVTSVVAERNNNNLIRLAIHVLQNSYETE